MEICRIVCAKETGIRENSLTGLALKATPVRLFISMFNWKAEKLCN
jgi:hypothetical protein